MTSGWLHLIERRAPGPPFPPTRREAREFLERLGALGGPGLEIHAYCLLGTHAHLLVRATGPLPEALASSRRCPVRAARHRLEVSRYVHRNPVEAGLAASPQDWPYSSYRGYLDPRHAPAWLVTSAILGFFGSIGARASYHRFVEGKPRGL